MKWHHCVFKEMARGHKGRLGNWGASALKSHPPMHAKGVFGQTLATAFVYMSNADLRLGRCLLNGLTIFERLKGPIYQSSGCR